MIVISNLLTKLNLGGVTITYTVMYTITYSSSLLSEHFAAPLAYTAGWMFKRCVNLLLLLSPNTRLLPRGGHGMVGYRGLHTHPACWQQVVQVTVSQDKRKVKLLCEGEQERRLHGIWLRHNCRCPTCTSVHHNQTVVDPKLLHKDLQVESARMNGEH